MNAYTKSEYRRLRAKGWPATDAMRAARTLDAWTDAESEGLVRLDIEMDDPEIALDGDFDEKTRDEIVRRVNNEGCWSIAGYYRMPDGTWEICDSVGGFVGDDWRDSGHDMDVMQNTLDAMRKAWDEHAEGEAAAMMLRATYAMVP